MVAISNLVHQSSSSTGTGDFTLASVNGKQTFSDAFGTGGSEAFFYFVSNRGAAEYEYGLGHMSDATTLVRDTVQGGTNGTSPVSFSAGTKDVTNALPVDEILRKGDYYTQSEVDAGFQPLDADLTAVAGLSSAGLIARTGSGTAAARTLTAPAAGISVSNGNGVSGNPTLALANDLSALEALSSTGLAARTTTDTWAQRTITGTANQIAVTNGDGVSGNPTIAATVASQAEAEAGTDTTKLMTALRVAQAIAALADGGSGIASVVPRLITSSGTYTPTAGMLYALIIALGGGEGGAAASGGGAGTPGVGGDAGSEVWKVVAAADIGASKSVTIGSGGSSASNGGDTSVGSLCVAPGGGSSTTAVGDLVGEGEDGFGNYTSGDAATVTCSGRGGSTRFGSGGAPKTTSGTGVAGTGYGSGGSGGRSSSNAGGAGRPGLVFIIEFCG